MNRLPVGLTHCEFQNDLIVKSLSALGLGGLDAEASGGHVHYYCGIWARRFHGQNKLWLGNMTFGTPATPELARQMKVSVHSCKLRPNKWPGASLFDSRSQPSRQ